MMTISIILLYFFGSTVVIGNAKKEGRLTISDIVMISIAPCIVLPVIILRITSFFVNVDKVVKYYD